MEIGGRHVMRNQQHTKRTCPRVDVISENSYDDSSADVMASKSCADGSWVATVFSSAAHIVTRVDDCAESADGANEQSAAPKPA